MAAGWSADKTRFLIELWGDANVQNDDLDGVQRNRTIYDKIVKEVEKLGYCKTWKQCIFCTP